MKLVQKRFLKDSREFEIADDAIRVCIRSPFRERTSTVMLTMVNPEPVVNRPFLEFHGRVSCGPLVSLLIDKPSAEEFNAFVDELKHRARLAYSSFAGLRAGTPSEGPAADIFEEPPDFDRVKKERKQKSVKSIKPESIDSSIEMLQRYMNADEIRPFIEAMQALRADPEDEPRLDRLVEAFDELGHRQGAVLTYAPYVGILLSDDPFE